MIGVSYLLVSCFMLTSFSNFIFNNNKISQSFDLLQFNPITIFYARRRYMDVLKPRPIIFVSFQKLKEKEAKQCPFTFC